jgi:hypothetical protein
MYLTINFAYKPVNTGNLIKQYLRTNSKTAASATADRASILKYMGASAGDIQPLSHDIGGGRKVITGVTELHSTKGPFPGTHVSYVASAPRKSKLAKQGAVDDLADKLYDEIGTEGVFDLTANGKASNDIYKAKLGTDAIGQGTGRGLRDIIKKRKKNLL